jgi:lipid A ethanolaminephosphotransferase
MNRMSLRLFRSTGYHSILAPGETRIALHPGWAVLGASAWTGFACNAWLWLAAVGRGDDGVAALFAGVVIASACGFVLSLACWRRTFKPVATVVLLLAALACAGAWSHGMGLQQAIAARPLQLLPGWAALFGWQVPALLVVLGGVPVLWLWNTQLRRLSGSEQLRANLAGMAIAALCGVLGWIGSSALATAI